MITAARRYELAENDREGSTAMLDADQVAALRTTGLVDALPEPDGLWRLLPRGRVGAVDIDGIDVVVRPKVGIARLLFLLGYARDPGFRPEDVEGVRDDELSPAVAESLCRQAERALARGVLQGYVTENEALMVVRGRIRLADQIARRPGSLLPLEVSYDEYSHDIAENRLLRTAIRRVLCLPRIGEGLRARLRHLDTQLDGVAPLVPGAPLPTWRPSRLNAQYQPALRLSELVLRTLSFEAGSGRLSVASFVVDMAAVFEDFVTAALTEAWAGRPGTTIPQYAAHLDVDRTIHMKVDVVHVVDHAPRVLADAKYKLADASGRYPNADHYQMLAYCTALQVDKAWLVYAGGTTGALPHRILNTPVTIVEFPLDLTAPPRSLLDQIDQLATVAWSGTIAPQ